MCGRACCTLRPEAVPAACGFGGPVKTVDSERCHLSYNVSPGSYMPVLRYSHEENTKDPIVHYMKWGLIPSFTRKSEQLDHFRMFNARSESIHEKASFRRLLPRCRCLVSVEGFYEWKKDGTKKQPYYIRLKDDRPLVFAALFDRWTNSEGEALYTFTILTTRSSKALEWLHDRMPVILGSKASVDEWLKQDISDLPLQSVTQPYEAEDLVWYPVTPAMGKTSFDGPECIKEIKPAAETKNAITQIFNRKSTVRPHSTVAHKKQEQNLEGPTQEAELKLPEGSVLDENELKAFLAAMHPDEDRMTRNTNDKLEDESVTKEKLNLLETRSKIKDIDATWKPSDGKGVKRKQAFESSLQMKNSGTVAKEKQRTLLNFFGKK